MAADARTEASANSFQERFKTGVYELRLTQDQTNEAIGGTSSAEQRARRQGFGQKRLPPSPFPLTEARSNEPPGIFISFVDPRLEITLFSPVNEALLPEGFDPKNPKVSLEENVPFIPCLWREPSNTQCASQSNTGREGTIPSAHQQYSVDSRMQSESAQSGGLSQFTYDRTEEVDQIAPASVEPTEETQTWCRNKCSVM